MNKRSPTPLEIYSAYVRNHPRDTPREIYAFILRASRLAALEGGDADLFKTWPGLVRENRDGVATAMRKHIRNGLNAAFLGDGLTLAHSVLEAQDHACFLEMSAQLTPGELDGILDADILEMMREWRHFAGNTALDALAAGAIAAWRETFPVSPGLLLPNVVDPSRTFSAEEYWPTVRCGIPEVREIRDFFAELEPGRERFAATGDLPSPELIKAVHLDKWTIDCGDQGRLTISRMLNTQWYYSISVSRADGAVFPLESVTFGYFPAFKMNEREWYLILSDADMRKRLEILNSDIWLLPLRGTKRLCLPPTRFSAH